MDAREDSAVWNAWYPLGDPVDLRRQGRTATRLLDREIALQIHRTWISASCAGRALPVFERLGYVWTTLGEPDGPPHPLIEYYEVDRLSMNVWSTPIRCSGLRIVDNVIDNAHFPFLHPGILGDREHLELPPHENVTREDGLWSLSHRAWLPLTGAIAEYTYWIPAPFSVILHIHRPQEPEGRAPRYDYLGVFAQPVNEESFIAHKMLSWVREPWMDERQLRADQQWISVQDKYALERHQPRKLPLGAGHEASVGADSASVAYRGWLARKEVRYGAITTGRDR
jgi:phenylpropionate dioxygenase-like ring-hydroxylating dioxygenase large terminal subunit